jgi:chondroitin AC lyase
VRSRIPGLLCALTLALSAEAAAQSVFDGLEKQFDDYYTGAGADRGAPRVREALGSLEHQVEFVTAPGLLRSDGSWSDINYQEVPSGTWSPWDHFRRLMIMARAYRTAGHRFHRDPALLLQIESALGYLPLFYGSNVPENGNWWFWVIGPALDLGPTLVLMRDDIHPDLLGRSTDILADRIGPYPGITPKFSLLEGQNLVWSALTHYSLALLERDSGILDAVRGRLRSVATPASGADGLQHDATFHQHGPQLYTGGYGGSYGVEMAKYLVLTRGTAYSLDQAQSGSKPGVADFAADGIAWALYHNYFDVSTIGREVAKPWTNGFNGLATLLQMSIVPSARQTEIRRAARRMLDTWTETLPMELAALAAALEAGVEGGAWPRGHRHYWVSDYTVHRRDPYFASVKMLSTRTRSGERTNGENMLGSRQSDGRFHLVIRGDEYAAAQAWPTLDWSRLPGTTVEQRSGAANSTYGTGLRSFVGGASDGQNGVSAMDFAAIDSPLTAKKGWVFFDDAIVFFVNSIQSLTGNRVETIVDQRPMASIDSPVVQEGNSWIAAGGIGYWFPSGQRVEMRREMRTGSWGSLGGPGDQLERSNPILTLWIDHGAYPANARAEYVIVPAVDPSSLRSWVASNPISILANHQQVSAARHNDTGALGIIFWSPSSVEGISASAPSVLYQTTSGNRMELSLADPAQGSGAYEVTLPGRFTLVSASPGVTLTSGVASSTLTVPKNGGRTVRVTLQQASRPRTRGARR